MKKWDKRLVSKLRKKWWWLRPEKELKKFEDDPWGQAFELFRRLPEFSAEFFFAQHQGKKWPSLNRTERADFRLVYGSKAIEKGLFPVKIWGGSKAIVFDCRAPGNSILDALKSFLNDPPPFASSAIPYFRSKSRLGTPDVIYQKNRQPTSFIPLRDPYRIEVQFSDIVEKKTENGREVKIFRHMFRLEIATQVRRLIKRDIKYRKHRIKMIEKFGALPTRRRFTRRTLTFKIMAIDAENEGLNTSDLGRLLVEYFPTNILFKACGNSLQRKLKHAKDLII